MSRPRSVQREHNVKVRGIYVQSPSSTAGHVLTGAGTGQPQSHGSRMRIVTAGYQECCGESLSHC